MCCRERTYCIPIACHQAMRTLSYNKRADIPSKMNVNNSKNLDQYSRSQRENSKESKRIGPDADSVKVSKAPVAGKEEIDEDRKRKSAEVVNISTTESTGYSRLEEEGKKTKRKRKSPLIPWKKPKGMPKRPLSAYNLFFQDRRKIIMEAASKSKSDAEEEKISSRRKSPKKKSGVGFANLARTIGTEWKASDTDTKAPYEALAATDKERYDKEMLVWRAKEKKEKLTRKEVPMTSDGGIEYYGGGISTVASPSAPLVPRKGSRESDRASHSKYSTGFSSPFTEMIGRSGDQPVDSMQSIHDNELKDLFHPSIQAMPSNHPNSLDPSSQMENISTRQQLHNGLMSATASLSDATRNQLSEFTNSMLREQSQELAFVEENLSFNVAMGAESMQSNPSSQFQNPPFLPYAQATEDRYNFHNNDSDTVLRRDPGHTLNLESSLPHSMDLEPLPLPLLEQHYQHQQRDEHLHQHQHQHQDDQYHPYQQHYHHLSHHQQRGDHQHQDQHQQHQHQHQHQHQQQQQQQQQQQMTTEGRNSWSGHLQSLQQMSAEGQQRRINVSPSEQYLQRRLSTGRPSSLSSTGESLSSIWFGNNGSSALGNEPSRCKANQDFSRKTSGTTAAASRNPFDIETACTNETIGRNFDNHTLSSSSTIAQQDSFAEIASMKSEENAANSNIKKNQENDEKSFF